MNSKNSTGSGSETRVKTSPIREALTSAQVSAVHFEARDAYTPDDPDFLGWLEGRRFDPLVRYAGWVELMSGVVARGVTVRRLRIVSEPVTDYIRFEHFTTAMNIAAGEQVRWLPRRSAVGLLVPAVDGWVFDGETGAGSVIANHFAGDGSWPGEAGGTEVVDDADMASVYLAAFDEAWCRGLDHQEYDPN